MCPPFGQLMTPQNCKECHTQKPNKGCGSCCSTQREIGRVAMSMKLKDSKGNAPIPLRIVQSKICPMALGSSIPNYGTIAASKSGKVNQSMFFLPNGILEFVASVCGEMPVPGLDMTSLPACPAIPVPGVKVPAVPVPNADGNADGKADEQDNESAKGEGALKLIPISNCACSFQDNEAANIVKFATRCQIVTLMLFNDYMELGCKMNTSS